MYEIYNTSAWYCTIINVLLQKQRYNTVLTVYYPLLVK